MELQEDRPAYVRFEVRAIEDRAASQQAGVYMTKDVEMVLITPPYSKDCVEMYVNDWLTQIAEQAKGGRIPEAWARQWKESYEAWKKGQEAPINGVPVKGWPVVSPAQQQNLIALGFLAVEDVAAMNDEGARRYGMGAQDLKNKAIAWLKSADRGKVTQENAALKAELESLKAQMEEMRRNMAPVKTKETEYERPRKAA